VPVERRRKKIIAQELRDGGEIPRCAGRPFVEKRTGGRSRPAALGMTVVIGGVDGRKAAASRRTPRGRAEARPYTSRNKGAIGESSSGLKA